MSKGTWEWNASYPLAETSYDLLEILRESSTNPKHTLPPVHRYEETFLIFSNLEKCSIKYSSPTKSLEGNVHFEGRVRTGFGPSGMERWHTVIQEDALLSSNSSLREETQSILNEYTEKSKDKNEKRFLTQFSKRCAVESPLISTLETIHTALPAYWSVYLSGFDLACTLEQTDLLHTNTNTKTRTLSVKGSKKGVKTISEKLRENLEITGEAFQVSGLPAFILSHMTSYKSEKTDVY